MKHCPNQDVADGADLLARGEGRLLTDAPKMKKFLTKPLVIEDQGSFFIGGVPKVTNYATAPPPNNPNQAPAPEPDHDRADVRPVRDPGDQEARCAARHHGAWLDAHGGMSRIHAGRAGRLVSRTSCARASPLIWSIKPDADAPGSMSP